MLLQSRFGTRKKEETDLFFVPAYPKCVRVMRGLNDKEINQTYVKGLWLNLEKDQLFCLMRPNGAALIYGNSIQNAVGISNIRKLIGVCSQFDTLWDALSGHEHLELFGMHCLDMSTLNSLPVSKAYPQPQEYCGAGAHLFKSWATYSEGDLTDKRDTTAFNTWKDILIPGNIDDGMTTQGSRLVEPLPLSKSKHLANYFGRAQRKVGRLMLIELSKQFQDKLECPEMRFCSPEKLGRREIFLTSLRCEICLASHGE